MHPLSAEQDTCSSSTGDKFSSGDNQDPYDTCAYTEQRGHPEPETWKGIFTQSAKSRISYEDLTVSKEGPQAQGPILFRPLGTDWKTVHMRLPVPTFSFSLKPNNDWLNLYLIVGGYRLWTLVKWNPWTEFCKDSVAWQMNLGGHSKLGAPVIFFKWITSVKTINFHNPKESCHVLTPILNPMSIKWEIFIWGHKGLE